MDGYRGVGSNYEWIQGLKDYVFQGRVSLFNIWELFQQSNKLQFDKNV